MILTQGLEAQNLETKPWVKSDARTRRRENRQVKSIINERTPCEKKEEDSGGEGHGNNRVLAPAEASPRRPGARALGLAAAPEVAVSPPPRHSAGASRRKAARRKPALGYRDLPTSQRCKVCRCRGPCRSAQPRSPAAAAGAPQPSPAAGNFWGSSLQQWARRQRPGGSRSTATPAASLAPPRKRWQSPRKSNLVRTGIWAPSTIETSCSGASSGRLERTQPRWSRDSSGPLPLAVSNAWVLK